MELFFSTASAVAAWCALVQSAGGGAPRPPSRHVGGLLLRAVTTVRPGSRGGVDVSPPYGNHTDVAAVSGAAPSLWVVEGPTLAQFYVPAGGGAPLSDSPDYVLPLSEVVSVLPLRGGGDHNHPGLLVLALVDGSALLLGDPDLAVGEPSAALAAVLGAVERAGVKGGEW